MEYETSPSGYYAVELARPFEDRGFTYKPGTAITVDEDLLSGMIAAEVVMSIASAV